MTNDSVYQQLLENPRFVSWAISQSPEDNEFWQTWLRQNPGYSDAFRQARVTIMAIYGKGVNIPDEMISQRIALALSEAKQREQHQHHETTVERPAWTLNSNVRGLKRWLAAASVLVALGLGWSVYQNKQDTVVDAAPSKQFVERTESAPLKEVVYTGNAIKHVRLSDGSSVVLFKNSKLTYPENFTESKRIVSLSGDAFFEVTKDPSKPFYVYAGGIITKVLGTSFSIKTGKENASVTVLVKTGKVAVYLEKEAKNHQPEEKQPAFVLSPNEQVLFDPVDSHLTRTLSLQTGLLEIPIEKQHFTYNHTPMSEVFRSLEKAYGVAIRYDKTTFSNCSLSAELGDEPLDTKLEWICSILEASYQIRDQEIVVTGKPCD